MMRAVLPELLPPEIQQPIEKSDAPKCAELGDLRFRQLLTPEDWAKLPPAIKRRFSKRLSGSATALYVGIIDQMNTSRTGRVFAQLCRMIGAPLPLYQDTGTPSIVSVTEDAATGGQIWTRLYARRNGFPQIIQSSKRFSGPTGLEEYIGYGITMALKAQASTTALTFKSAGYYLMFGNYRLPLPRLLNPGLVTVKHEEVTPENFRFSLKLEHPRFGVLLQQSGLFHEEAAK